MSRSSRPANKKTAKKHHMAMKAPNRTKIGRVGRLDLMLMAESKESRAVIKKDIEAWLKKHKIGVVDNMGKLHREWRK